MGAYKYVQSLWRKKQSDVMRFILRVRAWEYRQLPGIVRLTKPSRPVAAKQHGYKAKQGYVIFRVRVTRGQRKRMLRKGINYGKPSQCGIFYKNKRNSQSIAETKVGRKVGGLRLLNSYWVAADGKYKYYEVIMVDAAHAAIRNDPQINWIVQGTHKHREQRGLTAAGKKYRGLRNKGIGSYKLRPSVRASFKRRNQYRFARRR